MTYCVGMLVEAGLVFMSDTRTNSGVDNIAMYRKLFNWTQPGESIVTLLTVGNLATTQSVVNSLNDRAAENGPLFGATSLFDVARLSGKLLREAIGVTAGEDQAAAESKFSATLILGGQVKGERPRLFMVYPEGNFIEAGADTPFFQAGETKYGKPILVRAYDPKMSVENAIKLLLVSFDSTIKANLSVGAPLDLQVIRRDALAVGHERRFAADDPYFAQISNGWGDALKRAFEALPDYRFA